MSDNDLIRRGDATAICQEARESGEADMRSIISAIKAIPADDRMAKLVEALDATAEDATAKGETHGQMLDRLGMDGAKWAAEFRTTALRLGYSDMDEGWLIGLFANAIMAGYDRATLEPDPRVEKLVEALDNLLDAITASDEIGDRTLTITGSTANLTWLLETEDDARAALAAWGAGK